MELDSVMIVLETALTGRGTRRTITVPKEVVEAMELEKGDRLRWRKFKDRTILLTRAKAGPGGGPNHYRG